MTITFNLTGHFSDEDAFRENEVRFDELCREFVERLQSELGAQNISSAGATGQYIGTQNYIATSEQNPVTDAPTVPDDTPSDFLDESVVGEGEDDGLDDDEEDEPTDPDATGDHPGDVLNDEYAEDLSQNRSVPGVELSPNPEDSTGHQS